MKSKELNPASGRFLHLIQDNKFIDAACTIFEEAMPNAHDYLLIGHPPFRYLRRLEPTCMEIIQVLEPRFLINIPAYTAIFIHYLSKQARLLVASAPANTQFIWLAWGSDYYHLIRPHEELILPKTRALLTDPRIRLNHAYEITKKQIKKLRSIKYPSNLVSLISTYYKLYRIRHNSPDEIAIVHRFNAISTPIKEDFDAIQKRYPDLKCRFFDWNYYIDGYIEQSNLTTSRGHIILLGNSATPENNHLEALDILKECLPADFHIICPLSYGDHVYGNAVEQYGKTLFDDRFVALREYMPSLAYKEIIEGCSVVIMNHIRQQALGNIAITLCAGAKLFLNPRNPINKMMKRIGVDIYSTQSLPDYFKKPISVTPFDDLQSTRRIIAQHFGRASILRRTRTLLHELQ